MKNFDFHNDTSENIFSHPCISFMTNERLQGEEQFHSKYYFLEMPRSSAKMRLKKALQNKWQSEYIHFAEIIFE